MIKKQEREKLRDWSIKQNTHFALVLQIIDYADRLEDALKNTLEKYVALANSGDAGFWDPENEDHVRAARQALEGSDDDRS